MKNLIFNLTIILIGTLFFANSVKASLKDPSNVFPENSLVLTTNPYIFAWTLVGNGGNPDSYEIQISDSQDFGNIIIDLTGIQNTDASIDLSSLTNGSTYYWRVIAMQNKNTSISLFTSFTLSLTQSSSLPVELSSFSGSVNGNGVLLKWTTATEVNNYGFEIERSSEYSGWSQVGFVAGSGNSNSVHNYSFTDKPNGGITFSYRIKQIDNDGTFKYYDAITVSINGTNQTRLLLNSPNPFNPSTTIKFYVPSTENVTLTIYNIIGEEVTTLVNNQVSAGYHITYWNGKDNFGNTVASGIYLYRLQAGNFVETKKMNLLK